MSWQYFKREEFACRHCGENLMADDFIGKLDALRQVVGFPLVVNSGYRCPVHNATVSTTGPNGPHTSGRAADLAVDHERAFEVLNAAFRMGLFTGIGVQQKGMARFIHLDDLEEGRPTVWSY